MSGAIVVRQLLVGNAAVTALVPPADEPSRIVVGMLAKNVVLPALSIRVTSSVERKTLTPGPVKHMTDRVQVMVLAENEEDRLAVTKAVAGACGFQRPEVEGLSRVVALAAGIGDDLTDEETSILMKPHDFTVTYNEPR